MVVLLTEVTEGKQARVATFGPSQSQKIAFRASIFSVVDPFISSTLGIPSEA